jgi:hypothetical protein
MVMEILLSFLDNLKGGGFGKWRWNASSHPSDIEGLIKNVCKKLA